MSEFLGRSRKLLLASLIAGLLTAVPRTTQAQEATGSIVGAVTDPAGALVPGAQITLTAAGTNRSRVVVTNATGDYQAPYLVPGEYKITAEHAGFQRAAVSRVTLDVGQTVRVDFHLKVGNITQTVQVMGNAGAELQTENASLGETVNRQVTEELPLNGRSFAQLAELVPGVYPAVNSNITLRRNRGSIGTSIAISANGFAPTQNMYSYDGVPAMDLDSYDFSFSPSIDSIQEFRVETSDYSAEYGGAPGAFIDLVTKSGTNSYHGTVWEFNRNDAFSARNVFNSGRQRLNRNQFGANFGGPIPKARHKAFFFFNWEAGRQIQGTASQLLVVPPPAFRNGDFSSLVPSVKIVDPTTGLPFANNTIPSSRIRPASAAYLQFTPAPNVSSGSNNFLTPTFGVPTTENQYIGRVDYDLSTRNTFFVRYVFDSLTTNTVLPVFGNDQDNNNGRTQNTALNWTHTFSPTWVANFLAGWDRFFETEELGTTGNAKFNIACGVMHLPGVACDAYNYGPPAISAGYSTFTVRSNGPRTRLNQLWDFDARNSIQLGKHLVKFGGKAYRRNWTFNEALEPRGVYSFDGRQTAGGAKPVAANQFADFLLGLANTAVINPTGVATRMYDWNLAFYGQDDWRVTRSLTANLGIRWDFFQRPLQSNNRLDNFALGNGGGLLASQQIFINTAGYPEQLVFNRYGDWGPRAGLAWNPRGGKTVIRAGYGLYYSPEITNSYTLLTFNPPFTQSVSFVGSLSNPLQYDSPALLARAITASGALGAFGVDPHIKDTSAAQWNLTVERQLPASILLEISYVGTKGTHLTTGWNANRPVAIDAPGAIVRPLPAFGAFTVYGSALGYSNYNALEALLERRVAKGLTFLGAYTYSKALGTVDGNSFGTGDGGSGVQNIFDLASEYSYLNFDVRNRASAS
ncbi:MAG: carboxypeptidase regulatory-like domain-containing protein, partial [Terriglobia bacterium]